MSDRTQPTAAEKAEDLSWKIPLSLVDPSPFQHRKRFDEDSLKELADSIRKHGQLDDALVRPVGERFELIAGERRKRACEIAGKDILRCKVREMSDDDARELVIIQQLQYDEWTITEEAAGYADLLAIQDKGKPRFTYATLAARIDRKESHIRELVALLDTPEEMRQAVDAKQVSKRAAAYVASVPDPEQRRLAAQMVLHPADKMSPLTATETIALIQDKFVRRLGGAPFKLKDGKLLPAQTIACEGKGLMSVRVVDGAFVEEFAKGQERTCGGACDDCPFRTGNMRIFFGQLQAGSGGDRGAGIAPDLCTRPECYKRKCEAVEQKVRAEAAGRGCELMPDDEAARLFDKDGKLRENIDYVDRAGKPDPTLCHHFDANKMPTWKQLLTTNGCKVKAWLAQNPVTGDFVELIKWNEAVKAVNDACRAGASKPFFKAGEKVEAQQIKLSTEPLPEKQSVFAIEDETIKPSDNIMLPEPKDELWDKDAQRQSARDAKAKLKADNDRRLELMASLHTRLLEELTDGDGTEVMKLFTEHQLQFSGDLIINELCRYYGLQAETEDSLNDLLVHRDTLSEVGKVGFLVMIMIRSLALRNGPDSESIAEWCRVLGVEEEPASEAETTGEPTLQGCDECARRVSVPAADQAKFLKLESGEFLCTCCGGDWTPLPDEAQPQEVREKLGLVDYGKPGCVAEEMAAAEAEEGWYKEALAAANGEPAPVERPAIMMPKGTLKEKSVKQAKGDSKKTKPKGKAGKAKKAAPVKKAAKKK